jgi:hypothetical protein
MRCNCCGDELEELEYDDEGYICGAYCPTCHGGEEE